MALEQAGENRGQLELVLNKYYGHNDQKYKAACFLIANMPYHETESEIILDSTYLKYFEAIDSLYKKVLIRGIHKKQDRYDSIKKSLIETFNALPEPSATLGLSDIKCIGADFLIENIELAFQEWDENPLLKGLSFDEFKELVLPYRATSEHTIHSRGVLKEKYRDILSKQGFENIRTVIKEYDTYIENLRVMHKEAIPKEHLGLYDMYMSAFKRNCFNITTWSCDIFRACGVPVYFEFTPQYRDRNTSHYWCASPDSTGIPLPYTVPDNNLMDDWESELQYSGKVYRRIFEANRNTPYFTLADYEEIPAELSAPTLLDVTWRYHKSVTLRIPIGDITENKNAYLCLFNSKKELTAVGWGKIDKQNKEVIYEQVPVNQLFFPAYYDNGELIPYFKPFVLLADSLIDIPAPFSCKEPYTSLDLRIEGGKIVDTSLWRRNPEHLKCQLIEPNATVQNIHLIRKYPEKRHLKRIRESQKGAVIVGYNERKKYDTLFILPTIPEAYMQELAIHNSKTYKHYFFSVPNHPVNIAEIEFLSDKLPKYLAVTPTPLPVFSTDTVSENRLKKASGTPFKYGRNPWSAFDGDMETSSGGRFVGMDFDIPICVTHIRFAPRNANNMIVKGNRYELMYFDEKWKSGGVQTALYNYLIFKNIPNNTIYWLRNLDQGKEELPFFYIAGKQIFISEKLDSFL